MEKTLRKLKKELKKLNGYQIIRFEKKFLWSGDLSYQEIFETLSFEYDIDFNIDFNTSDDIKLFELFEELDHIFYDETIYGILAKYENNSIDLLKFGIEIYKDDKNIKSLEGINSIQFLTEQLTKKEVFKLLSNDNITDDVNNLIEVYSPEFYNDFFELTDGTINKIPLKYYYELIEYVKKVTEKFLEDEKNFKLFVKESDSTKVICFKLTNLEKDKYTNYYFSLHYSKDFHKKYSFTFNNVIEQIFDFADDLECINKEKFIKYYNSICSKNYELEEKVKNFQKKYL